MTTTVFNLAYWDTESPPDGAADSCPGFYLLKPAPSSGWGVTCGGRLVQLCSQSRANLKGRSGLETSKDGAHRSSLGACYSAELLTLLYIYISCTVPKTVSV